MGRGVLMVALAVAMLGLSSPGFGQNKPCTSAEENQAEKDVDSLTTWDQLYRSYKKFAPQCDDGAVAEGLCGLIADAASGK